MRCYKIRYVIDGRYHSSKHVIAPTINHIRRSVTRYNFNRIHKLVLRHISGWYYPPSAEAMEVTRMDWHRGTPLKRGDW